MLHKIIPVLYIFQLKQKDRSKILPVFHILVALIFFFDFKNAPKETIKDWIFSSVSLIACIFLLAAGFFSKKIITDFSKHLALLLFESVLITSGAIYFWSKGTSLVAASHVLLAVAIILFWIYLKKREEGEKIIISETHIILPGLLGKKVVDWKDLANLVKKQDLLTIDFKNNKLMQVEIISSDLDIEEMKFNQFCQQQLTSQK